MAVERTKYEKAKEWLSNQWILVVISMILTGSKMLWEFYDSIKDHLPSQELTQTQNVKKESEQKAELTDTLTVLGQGSRASAHGLKFFYIQGFIDNKIILEIEEHTIYKYSTLASNNILTIDYSGDFEMLPSSRIEYRFTGGNIQIKKNGNVCNTIEKEFGRIDLSDYSGTQSSLKAKIADIINTSMKNNFSEFSKEIIKCLN